MFKQTFLSAAIPYRLPWATNFPDGIPNGIGESSLYNGYLVTTPRIYGEELDFVLGLFAKREATAASPSTISIIGFTTRIYWPGWELLLWKFDGTNGEFISRSDPPGDINSGVLHIDSVVQGFDNSLWTSSNLGEINEFDPIGFSLLQTFSAAHFGRSGTAVPAVDKARDIVVMPSEGVLNQISVYTLSTGELINTINVSDLVKYICPVDGTRVFVLGENHLLNLVDYSTGEVLMTALCPTPGGIAPTAISWDLFYRRLLLFAPSANNTDGSGTSQIHGYYPVPLPTQMMTPIPLEPLRKGKVSPVLTRMTGDVGEPVAGQVMFSDTGDATMVNVAGQANGQGYAINGILCTDAGTTDVTVSANV